MQILVFTTCKPWGGVYTGIQTNAIRSWKSWKPSPTIMIFGDDAGSAEAAERFGAIHRPEVERLKSGHPVLGEMFSQAETVARALGIDVLMFANSDMVVVGLPKAAKVARSQLDQFLLVAYRRDLKHIDLDQPAWLEQARRHSTLGPPDAIDIFCFTLGLWGEIPRFFSGHVGFDNWLVMDVRDRGLPVIDATQVVSAFHQEHPPRLLHRPGDRANLEVLAEHEGGGSGRWAPRGRLTDATWIMAWDDLGGSSELGSPDSRGRFPRRNRVRMSLQPLSSPESPPSLVPQPLQEPEITLLELMETHESEPLPDDRHKDTIQPARSARVQRIYDRCSDGLRPATSDNRGQDRPGDVRSGLQSGAS